MRYGSNPAYLPTHRTIGGVIVTNPSWGGLVCDCNAPDFGVFPEHPRTRRVLDNQLIRCCPAYRYPHLLDRAVIAVRVEDIPWGAWERLIEIELRDVGAEASVAPQERSNTTAR